MSPSGASSHGRMTLVDQITKGIDLRGKVVLIDLWSYTSLDCLDRLPFMRGMWARYGHLPFLPIGVHVPEQDFAKGRAMMDEAVRAHQLDYPNASDDDRSTWNGLGRPAVPSRFLLDAKGVLRFSHIGTGGEQEIEAWVIRLLRENGSDLPLVGMVASKREALSRKTEVIHCGALQGEVGNDSEGEALKVCHFQDVAEHEQGMVYLDGEWVHELQYLEHTGGGPGHLSLCFEAAGLYAILASCEITDIEVLLDGRPITTDEAGKDVVFRGIRSHIAVGNGRLVHIIDRVSPGSHELKLMFRGHGQRIYSFTCVF